MSSLNGAGSPSSLTPGLVTPNTGTSGTASSLAITPGPSSSTSASGSGGGTLPRSGSLGGTALAQLQEEETEDSPPEMRVVNFFKRGLAAEICRDVQQYQSQPYNLAKCRPVWEFIMKGLDSVEGAGDLYDLSLVVEPREKEDEKVYV
jgi:son of sevenless-like protein